MTIKLHTITNVNGTDELFQMPEPYVSASLQVLQQDGFGAKTSVEYEVLGDSFFKLTPAPSAGSDLLCYYEPAVEDPIGTDTLSAWEKANISKLMSIIAYQSQTITNMQIAIDNRMTYEDFNNYTEVIEKDLKDVKESLLLL